jgi:hypothetical protein
VWKSASRAGPVGDASLAGEHGFPEQCWSSRAAQHKQDAADPRGRLLPRFGDSYDPSAPLEAPDEVVNDRERLWRGRDGKSQPIPAFIDDEN